MNNADNVALTLRLILIYNILTSFNATVNRDTLFVFT
jgi:hypothetical protein